MDSKQTRHISDEEYAQGWRLACCSKINADVAVLVPDIASAYRSRMKVADLSSPDEVKIFDNIKQSITEAGIELKNNLESIHVKMDVPTLDDTMPDNERLTRAIREITGMQRVKLPYSVIHKMDPRTKLLATVVYVVSLFVFRNIPGFIVATAVLIALVLLSKVPFKLMAKGLKIIWVLVAITAFFNVFFTPGDLLWQAGVLHITWQGVRNAVFFSIRLIYLILGTSIMTLTTTPNKLTDGLEEGLKPLNKIHIPVHEIAMTMSIALRFIPILLEAKTEGSHFTGLEIQAEMAEMASRSVALNRLEEKVSIVQGDIKEVPTLFEKASFDVVTTNPPYMNDSHGLKNPDLPKAIARHEVLCNLEDVVRAAASALRPGGRLYMVHRPRRLIEILMAMKSQKLEPKRMKFVHPFADKEANMVLIEAVRGGGALMNQGVHGIDLILWMLGDEVSTLYGRAETLARDIPVEDTAAAVLNMKHGGICVIQGCTTAYPGFSSTFYIHGEKGTVVFNDEGILEWKFLDEADAPQRPDMGERVGGAGDPTKIGNYGHICLLRDIAQAVRDGRSPAIPPQEAALAVRVICSIYESTRTGRPIVF